MLASHRPLRVGPGDSALQVTLYGLSCCASIFVKWLTPALAVE